MRAFLLCGAVLLTAATLRATPQAPAARAPQGGAARRPPPAAPARPDAAVPYRVGETLTFDVGWSNYLVAGSATSKVVERRADPSGNAYYIVAEGRPIPLIARFYPLFYKMDSLVDTVSTLSQRTSLYQEEAGRARSVTTTFDRRTRTAQFSVENDPAHHTRFAVPQNVQDGLATLYALRARTFRAGEHLTIPVADEGMLYAATFDVAGPEPVKVPMGTMDAWNLRVTIMDAANQPVGHNIGAWISTDARRLPVKLEADLPVGSFALTLRSAQ